MNLGKGLISCFGEGATANAESAWLVEHISINSTTFVVANLEDVFSQSHKQLHFSHWQSDFFKQKCNA